MTCRESNYCNIVTNNHLNEIEKNNHQPLSQLEVYSLDHNCVYYMSSNKQAGETLEQPSTKKVPVFSGIFLMDC